MYSILAFIRGVMYITSLILLISTIKTKNKFITINNLITSICFIFYYILDLFIIPNIFGIIMGWDTLIIGLFSGISSIVLIISIIVNLVKISKNLKEDTNLFIKHYPKLLLLPLVLIGITFIYELTILNNAELILLFEYNEGIINTDRTYVAVNKNSAKTFTISKDFKSSNKETKEYLYYDIEEDNNGEIIITSDYHDPNLEKIDIELVKKIYKDTNYKKSESAIKLYEDDENVVYRGYLAKLEGTDYYIMDYLISTSDRGGGTGLGSAIFYKDKFVDDLNASGDLDTIYLYKK